MADENVTNKARELLANRLEVVDALSTANVHLDQLKVQLSDAELAASTAWSAAVRAGWATSELRQLGFAQPLTRRGGRPKGSRTTRRSEKADAMAPEADRDQ